ncbi:hypothetical protein BDV93DRAFT_506168 [Ceratobasidium sp. AG-I]|nr:hypothetical protein BDV93DRAFT_506168 [Ceratobasidium sp. AG-I]
MSSPSSPSLRRHSQSRGHRYTKSLNSQATPPPLPLPRGQADSGYTSNKEDSGDRAETVIRQWKLQRSESMPPRAYGERVGRSSALPNLPDNPKLWTPSQLAQYLLTALRFKATKSSEIVTVPKPVAQEIANFVIKSKLNGRTFLRLANKDLEEMGINQLWRNVLLSSSLELRKSLLKGRIWGFGPEEEADIFNEPRSSHEPGRRMPSTVHEREETSVQGSVLFSTTQPSVSQSKDLGQYRSGVCLSRSSSTVSFDSHSSEYTPSHRRNRSRGQSISSNTSSTYGRVHEIIRNLERAAGAPELDRFRGNESAGFASGEMTSESEEDYEPDATRNRTIIGHEPADCLINNATSCPPGTSEPAANLVSSPPAPPSQSTNDTAPIETPLLSLLAELPITSQADYLLAPRPKVPGGVNGGMCEDEPTIEALLEEGGQPREGRLRATSWGAKAWEEEFPGGTSRRVPASALIVTPSVEPLGDTMAIQGNPINVPRSLWDNVCRRLEETERRIATLETQEAERRKGTESLPQIVENHSEPKLPSSPSSSSAATLPPYLVVVGVGVCAIVAQFIFGRIAGRRPHL